LVFLVALGLLSASALSIHYYARFNRLIDAKLSGQDIASGVYSRPGLLRAGQRLSQADLESQLERIGYTKGETKGSSRWYVSSPDQIRLRGIHNEPESFSEIRFATDRIQSIHVDGRNQLRIELPPEYVSSLFGRAREKRKPIEFSQLPSLVVKAVQAAEDDDYCQHPGVSVLGVVRAALVNLIRWDRAQGASTLTQQFVKNYFLTQEKTYRRKLEEFCFALLLERRLSKEKIFQLYANEVYLGQVGSFAILGLGQGAAAFFGKPLSQLTLSETALLAGIIQSPNRFSPHRHPDSAVARRNHVLDRMEEEGFISTRDNALARRQPLRLRSVSAQDYSEAPYFIDFLTQRLRDRYSVSHSSENLSIYSTLELRLQRAAYEATQKGITRIEKSTGTRKNPPVPQVALVAVSPSSGEILALVGGRDYASTEFNRAVHSLRQPGSSIKPFVYAAALQSTRGRRAPYSLATHFTDAPYTFSFDGKEYSPRNYGNRYHGPVSLRTALSLSLNVPTVRLAEEIGFQTVLEQCRKLGFSDNLRPYPSIALGTFEVTPLNLAQAYQALANRGLLVPLRTIQEVSSDGERTAPKTSATQVFSPEVSFLVASALKSAMIEGTGKVTRLLGFQLPSAGKTGSTQDSWFAGFTPDMVCVVWVGTDQNPPLNQTGAEAAAPIWAEFMLRAQKLGFLSGADFTPPAGVSQVRIDPASGMLASQACQRVKSEYFLKGTEPRAICEEHQPHLEED
jgi:penicillin-binding protein 1B